MNISIRNLAATAVATLGSLAMIASVGIASPQTAIADEPQQPQITAPGSAENGSRFTMAVIPDTQFYSRYSDSNFVPEYGKNPFDVQTQWIADHKNDFDIRFTTQLGDIVDQYWKDNEWQAADKAMKTLDDTNTPYSILPGNHDVTNADVNDNQLDYKNEPFVKWFGPNRAQHVSTYQGSDSTGMSQYHIFEAEGQQFLVFAFAWRISDDTIAWAQKVLDAHPTLPAIVTTHDLLNIAADQVTPVDPILQQGELWNKFISQNDQIFLTINGHFHGSTEKVRKNAHGKDVIQVLIDYQMSYEGGDGYMGLSEFDLTHNQFNFTTISPWVVSKAKDGKKLTSYDKPVLTDTNRQYSIDINYTERFKSFNPNFKAGTGSTGSLLAKAQASILDGFPGTPADDESIAEPGSTDDYTRVPGTLAFWRANDLQSGKAVTGDMTVKDASGNGNDLHRLTNDETKSATAQDGDVTVSDDHDQYSSAGKSLTFVGDNSTGRYSALSTAADAAVNNADLSKGYTIEAFVRVSDDWSAAKNQWTKILTRTGNRSRIPNAPYDKWDGTAAAAWLGISNLREIQWSDLPADASKGTWDTWSSEVPLGRWMHIAVVDDPATGMNTMYINGVPMIRTSQNRGGMSFEKDKAWLLGAGMTNDTVDNGWNGGIGEVRIIDHPTTSKDWLLARPDISSDGTLSVTDQPASSLPEGSSVTSLSGKGVPGADITVSGSSEGDAKVAEDGTWTVTLKTPATAAQNDLTVTQHMGTRQGASKQVTFAIAQPASKPGDDNNKPGKPGEGDNPNQPTQPGKTGNGGKTANATPNAAKPSKALGSTGSAIATVLTVAVIVLAAGVTALIIKRRAAHRH
ncbi:Ig-like domain-containing protein [Bifidobacterium aerophilum]|uniref:Cell wall anchor protein n=1 Tax=Bifidobacterium aerophilum TaxID=1798155 RepID=A0A6N9Z2K8_9BIFI|nr:Ig-like domain-containing protein [Bifidobacterium aerophilum]NEG88554.1 cell wall anchor protein [Bifidobacterium aerophilum]